MADQRSLEILIKARDLATAEFQKTQSWLDSLSGTSKKTTDEISKGFKGNVLTSIRDSVKELKSWIGAFSLIKVGREAFELIDHWLEVRKKTREAREELELYLNLSGVRGDRRNAILGLQFALAEMADKLKLTADQTTGISILAEKLKISDNEVKALAADAALLASRLSAVKGQPVAAFEALSKAVAGDATELNRILGTQETRERALIAIRRERLALEQDAIEQQKEAEAINVLAGFAGLSPASQQRAAELRQEAEAARDLARQYRDIKGLTAPDPAADRRKTIRDKADLILLDAQIRNSKAQAEREAIAAQRADFVGGLSAGFEQFRQELNDFHQQGIQTVTSLLGGVRDIGVGIVDGLVTNTLRGRDALKKFGEDMLRMLANLVAQLTLNRGLALLFNAIVPAAGAPPGSGGAGAGPTPGAPGSGPGLGASSFNGGLPSGLRNIGNRTIGGGGGAPAGGWGGSPTFNIILQATDTDGLERLAPKLVAIIKRALRGDREFQLEVKGAAA